METHCAVLSSLVFAAALYDGMLSTLRRLKTWVTFMVWLMTQV
jgi:hypothetical protein